MNGSNQTEITEKRKRPPVGARGRLKKQNPRSANNEEFAMTILPRFLPSVQGYLARGERSKSISYVYIHIDREQLTHEARISKQPSYLLGFELNRVRHPFGALLTHEILTHEKGGSRHE